MADERYQWLDEEAAERLLRGEPVDPVDPADDLARPRAGRLAEALDAVRTPVAGGELPGEAAALAAFREATAARAAAAPAAAPAPAARGNTAGETVPADLGRVRLARVAAPPRRWGRSARYGLAAAVAAVAVGGVAVAAGTGVLPLVGPAPASSVSAGETARPLVSPEPGDIREDSGIPGPPPPGEDRTRGASPSAGTASPAPDVTGPDTTAPDGDRPEGDGADRPKRDVPEPGRGTAGTDEAPDPDPTRGPDRDGSGNGNGNGNGNGVTDLRQKAVEACRAYRSGKLDDGGRRRLADTLRNGETLRRYCDRVLSGATGAPGNTSEDGSKGGSKGDGPRGGENGSHWGGAGDGRGDARHSTATAPATLPETGATTRLPLGV
ncbi:MULTISPECIES: hypothetical protein [unclassified Streptomyces]|uniref:hypothetical protein n=1 Tax=unclassified Streptomyces TaxID=2593676 RepID=UPI0035D95C07